MSSVTYRLIVSGVSALILSAPGASRAEDQGPPSGQPVQEKVESATAPAVAQPEANPPVTSAASPATVPAAPAPQSAPPAAPVVAPQPVGLSPLESGPTAVKGKWNPTVYGFLAFDMVYDSTQSFTSGCPGNFLIARPGTYAANHGRLMFDPRGSRFGFRLAAPAMDGMKATAVLEGDFVGNQLPTNYGNGPTGLSEGSTYTNGLFRLRHAAIKIETPYIDVLAGQYWQLFGWIPMYLPVTVQIPGVPGVAYGRSTQFRVSHTFNTQPVSVELAVAAARPPQRNSSYPDAQGAARLSVNGLHGVSAVGATGATFFEMPAGIGVSGVYRRLKVAEFTAAPTTSKQIDGQGLSIDAFIPIIPSRMAHKQNALNVTGNFTIGKGIADLYGPATAGNAGFPALAAVTNPDGTKTAVTWPQDIDNGLVTYDNAGVLHAIKWETLMVGGQYYLPPSGRVWIAGNYGYAKSSNIASYDLNPKSIVTKYTMWDAVMYVNVVGPATIAGEFAQEKQTYGDGVVAKNNRVMVSSFYTFW